MRLIVFTALATALLSAASADAHSGTDTRAGPTMSTLDKGLHAPFAGKRPTAQPSLPPSAPPRLSARSACSFSIDFVVGERPSFP
jgi:hypothetical protein